MYPIKQSTALAVCFFGHDDVGDAVTGLTDGTFTKRISKNGAAFAAMSVTISELENGWYALTLSASHTDTLGVLTITFINGGSSMKQVNLQFRVHARLPDDLAFPTVAGRSLDVTAGGAAGIDWANVENQGTAVDLAATDIQQVDTCVENTDMRGTDGAALASVLGALDDAAVDGDPTSSDTVMGYIKQLVNVLVGSAGVTTWATGAAPASAVSLSEAIRYIADQIGAAGDGLDSIPWGGSSWSTAVQNDVQTMILANHLDHLFAADYDPASKPGIATALMNELIGNDAGVSRFTANALELAPDAGDGSGLTDIPWNAAWDTDVEAAVLAQLQALGLDHLVSAAVAGADVADGSIVARLVSASGTPDWDSYDNTTDSLEAIRNELTSQDAKLDVIDDLLDTEIAAILADVVELNDTKIPDTISLAAINAQVVDALATDTYGQPGQETPGATVSLAYMIRLLYKALINRSTLNSSANEWRLYDAAGTTIDQKADASDDGTTFDRGGLETGP